MRPASMPERGGKVKRRERASTARAATREARSISRRGRATLDRGGARAGLRAIRTPARLTSARPTPKLRVMARPTLLQRLWRVLTRRKLERARRELSRSEEQTSEFQSHS